MRRTEIALALACALALAAGCNKSSSGGGTLIGGYAPGNFPGHTVSNSFTAPDLAAASPAGISVDASKVTVWTDNRSRAAIATFTVGGYLFASYTAGDGRWTPFVAIAGARTQGNTPTLDSARVVFLNTAGHADAVARARDGDAVLLFQQLQAAVPAVADSDPTQRLWTAYFDLSRAGLASAAATDQASGAALTFRWGFQTEGLPVDDDPDDALTGNGSLHTSGWGLISDSLRGSHAQNTPCRSSGDPTSFVYALYLQDLDGAGAGAGQRCHTRALQLATADHYSFPAATATSLDVPAEVETNENAQAGWLAHDGSLFVDWTDTGGSDDDDPLWAHYAFSASGISSAVPFMNTDPLQNLSDPDKLLAANLYGADHGLGFTLLVYQEAGYGGNPGGTKNIDKDLYVATFDPVSGAQLGASTEADAFTSPKVIAQAAPTDTFLTRIARDGSWIAIAFIQNDDNEGGDPDDNLGVRVVAYDTSRDLSAGTLCFSDALELTPSMGQPNQGDVGTLEFQVELADGTSRDTRRNVQTDPAVMNVLYPQPSSATGPNLDLHVVGFRATLAAGARPQLAINSAGGAGGADTVIASVHAGWAAAPTLVRAAAYDRGSLGDVNVAFACQANAPTAAPGASNYPELRLFHWSGGGAVTLDTASAVSTQGVNGDQQVVDGEVVVVTSPRGTTAGAFSGNRAHVFVLEQDISTDAQLFHVAWDKTLATPGLGSFERVSLGNFTQPVVTPYAVGVSGDTAGVYWRQNEHLFYNRWSGAGWGGPALIDDAYPQIGVGNATLYLDGDGTSTSLDDLPSSAAFYDKQLDNTAVQRLLYRTHH